MTRDRKAGETRPAPVRLLPGQTLSQVLPEIAGDVKAACYEIWSGPGAMNAAATERLYAQRVGDGEPVPTPQTINQWARDDDWLAQVTAELERNHGQLLYEMQLRDLMNAKTAGEELSKVLAGLYDDNPLAGALRIKVRELLSREIERKVRPRLPATARRPTTRAWDAMSLEEQEAFVHGQIRERKQGGG